LELPNPATSHTTSLSLANRGAYDFEAFDWVNARCCGLLWGAPNQREFVFVHDYGMSLKPIAVVCDAVKAMFASGIKNWFAHNGGKYDVCLILEAITALGYKARGHIAAGRVVSLSITNESLESINLYDSMAIIPGALKKVARDFNLKAAKTLTEDDYSKDVREWAFETLQNGCRADCEVVLEALEVVESMLENEGGQLKSTFSACAFSVLKSKVNLPDTRKWKAENKLARLAYIGGRVEVFRHSPIESLGEWDVNSSYPYSMSQPDLPWELKGTYFGKQAAKAFESGAPCIVEASVSVADCYLPVLPYRSADGGVYFPVGEWTGYFTSEELRYATAQRTKVKAIHSAIAYSADNPFGYFIAEFYRLKSEGVGAVRNFYKLILNGCYGKFAQKPEKEVLRIMESQEAAFDLIFEKPANTVRMLSNQDSRFLGIQHTIWSKHTHYALAAFITARSRILLHRHMLSSSGLAYTDTDSIHASSNSRLPQSADLGGLKLEIPEMNAVYYAPKIYALFPTNGEPKYASKGFHVDAKTFNSVIHGVRVSTSRIQLVKKQIRNGNKMARIEDTRRWSGISAKRAPFENGETRPWHVSELQKELHKQAISPAFKSKC